VRIVGLTLNQTAATSANSHGMFVDVGDEWQLIRVTVKNSKHEGIVSGGVTRRWLYDHCTALDCGAGSEFRPLTGAGLNCNGVEHVINECETQRCGQGYECAGFRNTFLRCRALDGLTNTGPSVGFNIGNSVIGLYRVRVVDCKSTGHSQALQIGNTIGRCAGCSVENFDATDGGITYYGGLANNSVHIEGEGPDLEPTMIRGCTVRSANANGIQCFLVGDGGSAELGRSSVDVVDCTVELPNGEPDWMANAPFQAIGNLTGRVTFLRPVLKGPRGASKAQGDFYQGGGGTSAPNIKCLFGRAFKIDETERWFHPMRTATE
jgi:hypothetical protein